MIFRDHATLKYLFNKGDSKMRLLRWIFLLQDFDLEIKYKNSVESVVVDHLYMLENKEVTRKENNIIRECPNEHLMEISEQPRLTDMANYKATKSFLEDYTWKQKKQFYKDVNHYLWDEPYLFKISVDNLIHMCVVSKEARNIMWPNLFKDCKSYMQEYLEFHKTRNISK